ncbi:MAG: hypothetical protein SGI99_17190 [Pseudomonadota bacterium]|nr:hypothetical protein [Pseudomonadota bacterium]
MRAITCLGSIVFSLAATGAVQSAVLRVAGDSATATVRVFDGSTPSATFADATNMSVQLGSVTADAVGNRAFFVGNSAGLQSLYQLNYTSAGQALPQVLDPVYRITHLEWDSGGSPRLLGVAINTSDDTVRLISIVGNTVTDLGMPIANCCVFRSGVSAFRSTDDSLYLIGRRSTDTQDQFFRFTMNPPALAQSVAIPPDLSVNEIVVNASGSVLGLAYSAVAEVTLLFGTDAALNISTLGSGMSDCCFVMAGASALDANNNRLITLGPGIAGLAFNPPRLWSFTLGTGAISDGMTPFIAAGLFVDNTSILDAGVLFGDGFE